MQRLDVQVVASPKEASSQDTASVVAACVEHPLMLDEPSISQEEAADLPILSPKAMRPFSLPNCGEQYTKEKGK